MHTHTHSKAHAHTHVSTTNKTPVHINVLWVLTWDEPVVKINLVVIWTHRDVFILHGLDLPPPPHAYQSSGKSVLIISPYLLVSTALGRFWCAKFAWPEFCIPQERLLQIDKPEKCSQTRGTGMDLWEGSWQASMWDPLTSHYFCAVSFPLTLKLTNNWTSFWVYSL